MKRKTVTLVLAAAVAAVSVTGCSSLDGSETVLEVNGAKVTADVANFYARFQQAQTETYLAAYMGEDMWSGEISDGVTYEDSVKESTLESIKNLYVLKEHAADYDIALTEEEQSAVSKAAKSFSDANGLEEKEVVSGEQETVEKVLELLTIQQKMWTAMTADVNTEVSDEDAAQKSMQYVFVPFTTTDEEGNSKELTDDEKEELKAAVKEFREGAVSAEDFAAYAKDAGYEAKDQTFDAESTSPSEDLIKAADTLEEGQVTEVIEVSAGLYVAKVTSLLDREATDAEKESIVEERKQEQYDSLCDEWMDAADIKVYEGVWNKIDFEKQGVTIKDTATEE